jgi:hypothetical protein
MCISCKLQEKTCIAHIFAHFAYLLALRLAHAPFEMVCAVASVVPVWVVSHYCRYSGGMASSLKINFA